MDHTHHPSSRRLGLVHNTAPAPPEIPEFRPVHAAQIQGGHAADTGLAIVVMSFQTEPGGPRYGLDLSPDHADRVAEDLRVRAAWARAINAQLSGKPTNDR